MQIFKLLILQLLIYRQIFRPRKGIILVNKIQRKRVIVSLILLIQLKLKHKLKHKAIPFQPQHQLRIKI